jgi:hypothetical protein
MGNDVELIEGDPGVGQVLSDAPLIKLATY